MAERFAITTTDIGGPAVLVEADGWVVLLIRPDTGEVAVNDLRRRTAAFCRRWAVPMLRSGRADVTVTADGDVRIDGRLLAAVRLDPRHPTLAEVAIRDPDTGAEVADVAVRYRQVGLDHGGGLPGPGLTGR